MAIRTRETIDGILNCEETADYFLRYYTCTGKKADVGKPSLGAASFQK